MTDFPSPARQSRPVTGTAGYHRKECFYLREYLNYGLLDAHTGPSDPANRQLLATDRAYFCGLGVKNAGFLQQIQFNLDPVMHHQTLIDLAANWSLCTLEDALEAGRPLYFVAERLTIPIIGAMAILTKRLEGERAWRDRVPQLRAIERGQITYSERGGVVVWDPLPGLNTKVALALKLAVDDPQVKLKSKVVTMGLFLEIGQLPSYYFCEATTRKR